MRKFSFGKENDHPIPQKNSDDFNDLDELDFDDDMETEQKNEKKLNLNEKRKSNDNFSEEVEINSQILKNSELKLNSESEEDDSDKNNGENGPKKENKKEEEREDSKEDDDERDKEKKEEKEEEKDEEKDEEKEDQKEKEVEREEEKDEEKDEEKEEEKDKEKKEEKDKEKKEEKNEKNKKKEKKESEESEEDEEEEEEDDEDEEENKKEMNEKDPFEGIKKQKNNDKEIENILLKSIKNKENATSERIQMAEKINFKSIPDKIIATDQYGFIIPENNNNQDKDANKNSNANKSETDLLQINARMEKWNYMIEHYEEFKTKNFSKLKSRTRKGIPDSIRSYIWQLFGEKDKYYEKDLFSKLDKIPMDGDTEIVIIKDLDRTFPACQFFKEKYGNGQRKLYKVLSYYSKYNTDTGYVQGMGFIVAVFLTYMDEESSFFMLHSLMKKYNMEGFYLPGFPILKKTFYILLNLEKKFIPKIYELFKKEGMIPSMYASEWFICLFSRNLEFKSLVRIFDIFLLEGYKVIYRFALAFLKLKEDKFMEGKDGLASIMPTINECTENVDIEKMFKIAFGFSISRNLINQLGDEYEKIKDDSKNEFVKQL